MFSLTSTTSFALLAAVSLLPVSLSLPQPQIDEVSPNFPTFDVNAPLPPPLAAYPDFPIPGTEFFLRFSDNRDEFTQAEINCLFEKTEAMISARPAGEIIPGAGSWDVGTQGPFPYGTKFKYLYFVESNEGNNPRFTKELGLTVLAGFREWMKNKTMKLKLGGVIIVQPGSRHAIGFLGFSSQFRAEPIANM